ncbi:hypothetical protein ABZ023_18460 [Streptomyces sp. NPDC006367]|uniref:hypothetical protein n=1 Tax=unclassified Streptomyces TaxID=2593676 RepID=UPI0033A45262
MSDPAPKDACRACPAELESFELRSNRCGTRSAYESALIAMLMINLLVTLGFGVLNIVRDDSPAKPTPVPTVTHDPTAWPSPGGGGGEPTGGESPSTGDGGTPSAGAGEPEAPRPPCPGPSVPGCTNDA